MADEERREDEQQEDQPAEEAGAAEESASEGDAEAPQEEADQAAEAEVEAPQPEADQAAEAEVRTAESEREAEEARAETEPAEAEAEPAEAAAEPVETKERPKQAAKDVPPGAELEPISIEPERELSAEERARLEAEAEERARAEAEATAEAGEEPAPAREPAVELDSEARIQATGKRKTSIARVVLRSGTGEFQINRRSLEDYFPRHQLLTSGYEGKVDVRVRVHGGGIAGQAGAVRHGIARALTEIDPELRGDLKRRGLLTRDARAKERRKAGLKKARKRPQFSKR